MASIMQRKKKDGTPYYTATVRARHQGEVVHSESRSFPHRYEAETWAAQRERELAYLPSSAPTNQPATHSPAHGRQRTATSLRTATSSQTATPSQGAPRWGMEQAEHATRGTSSTASTRKKPRASMGSPSAHILHHVPLLEDLIHRYIVEYDQTAPLGRTKRYDLVSLSRSRLAQIPADLIRTDHVIAHVRERRALSVSGATVKNDLIWLNAIFRYARFAWNVPVDPQVIHQSMEICRVERLTHRAKKRYRRPSREEMEILGSDFLQQAARRGGTPLYLLTWFAIYSCRRLSEICRMRLPDFDEENLVWKVDDLKHPEGSAGNEKWAWITPEALPVIHAAIRDIPRKGQEDRLFPVDSKTVSTLWTKKMRMLGIEDLHFHDLRHEGSSRLADAGWTIPEIQKVSLHESWASLQIYVNASQTSPRNSKALGKPKPLADIPHFDPAAWEAAISTRAGRESTPAAERILRFTRKENR